MWMAEVEQCSGLKRSQDTLTYWIAPRLFLRSDGRMAEYVIPHQMIVFGLGSETVSWIVRHEALHHLLVQIDPEDQHPVEYYGGVNAKGQVMVGKCELLVRPPKASS
jgi:hypothetical protein